MQSVVAGEVGEGGVINHKGFGSFRCGELLANQTVGMLDTLAERVVTRHIVSVIGFIQLAEGFVGVSGDD